MKIFFVDLKDFVGSIQKTGSLTTFFDKYEIKEIDGIEYLCGYNEGPRKPKQIDYDFPRLLFDIIGLFDPPRPEWFRSRDRDEVLSKAISNKKVIKLCKKHGLPMKEGGKHYSPVIEDLWHRGSIAEGMSGSMDLMKFKRHVAELYFLSKVWLAIYYGDDGDGYLREFVKDKVNGNEDPVEVAKLGLSTKLTIMMSYIRIMSRYSPDGFAIGFQARSLIDVAVFQLANVITMKHEDVSRHLKRCNNSGCDNLFWPKTARFKYCGFCNRKMAWARKKKEGKK